MNIIILGPPGSGKGTVSSIISEKLKIPHISIGDIFRENIKQKTSLGIESERYISKGCLVPNEITNKMLEKRLNGQDLINGMILDGYPRTLEQCKTLDEILNKNNKKIDVAIYLNVLDEEILNRIINRRICSNKECRAIYNLEFKPTKIEGICDKCSSNIILREDDNEEVLKNRLIDYHKNSAEILEYYKDIILEEKDRIGNVHRSSKQISDNLIKKIISLKTK